MLKIQVLGRGLIPRGLGLAPRTEPFPADLTLIQTILQTPGLIVNMVHPDDGHIIRLTNQNLKRMWNSYNGKGIVKKPTRPVLNPAALNPPPTPPIAPGPDDDIKEETPAPAPAVVPNTKYPPVSNENIKAAVNNAFKEIDNSNAQTSKPTEENKPEESPKEDAKTEERQPEKEETKEENKKEESKKYNNQNNNGSKNNNGNNGGLKPINSPDKK